MEHVITVLIFTGIVGVTGTAVSTDLVVELFYLCAVLNVIDVKPAYILRVARSVIDLARVYTADADILVVRSKVVINANVFYPAQFAGESLFAITL